MKTNHHYTGLTDTYVSNNLKRYSRKELRCLYALEKMKKDI